MSSRTTRAFYAFTVFWSFNATGGLWILYLLHCHWSLFEIGLAEAGFHIVSFLSELPTGLFADRLGRRKSLAIGLIINAAATLVIWWSAPLSIFAGILSVALSALAWTFVGGADRALLYAVLTEEARPSAYGRIYSAALALNLATRAAAIGLGGFVASHDGWLWPYLITALASLMGLAPLSRLPEAQGGSDSGGPSMLSQIRMALSEARRIPGLARLAVFGAVLATLVTTNNLYAQSTLLRKGASLAMTALLVGAANVVTATGSLAGGRLASKGQRNRYLMAGTTLLGVAIAGVGMLPLSSGAFAYLGAAGLDGALDPMYETALNDAVPERYRSTMLSLPGAGFSFGMIVLFPLAGWAMQNHHTGLTYGVMGGGLMVLAAGFRKGSSTVAWDHASQDSG